MIKGYIYAGLILLAIAVVVFYSVSGYVTSATPTNIVNVTVPPHGINYTKVAVNSSNVMLFFLYADNLTNIYFLNQSQYTGLSDYLSGNSSRSASAYVSSHRVAKADVFMDNGTAANVIYPTTNGNSSTYNMYAVLDSTPGSPSYNGVINAKFVYKAYGYGEWVSTGSRVLVESLAAIICFIAGLALLILGAIKSPKVAAEAVVQPAKKEKVAKK
jgi:hypothetical protein